MSVSRRLRFEVLRRDNHTCRYCGASAPDVALTVDHVLPVALGGSDHPANLVTACADCNGGKTSLAPDASVVADVAQDALRWARAMTYLAEQAALDSDDMVQSLGFLVDHWASSSERDREAPEGCYDSWRRWMELGLTLEDVTRMADRALADVRRTDEAAWKYHCGCCWALLRERHDAARQLIEEGFK